MRTRIVLVLEVDRHLWAEAMDSTPDMQTVRREVREELVKLIRECEMAGVRSVD